MALPHRTLIEALHLAAGVIGTLAMAKAAAWGVPIAGGDIWTVAWVCVAVVAFWAIRPLRLAWRADHRDLAATRTIDGRA